MARIAADTSITRSRSSRDSMTGSNASKAPASAAARPHQGLLRRRTGRRIAVGRCRYQVDGQMRATEETTPLTPTIESTEATPGRRLTCAIVASGKADCANRTSSIPF